MLTESQIKNLKENVAMHLETFGKNTWLSSRYFFEHLIEKMDFSSKEGRERLEDFQRLLAITVNKIIQDQYIYKKYCIVSSNKGYKIANDEDDFEAGEKYLFSKIDPVLDRIRDIREKRKQFLNIKPETQDLFVKEINI